jgi:3',5'-cyclic AMP phosphodiesterase CpdA
MSVTLLHLSDIHAGEGEFIDQDVKYYLPSAARERMIDRLGSYIAALPKKPDFVIVSGDITLRGDRKGLEDVRDWLIAMVKGNLFPSYERIILTPGNHDPTHRVPNGPKEDEERYGNLFAAFGLVFPHAFLPGWDPTLKANKPDFTATKQFFGGIEPVTRLDKVELLSSYPFLLDLETDILIFAFNSSLACGVFTTPPHLEPLRKFLEAAKKADPGESESISKLLKLLEDSALVDAGVIGRKQLDYFADLMNRMRNELKHRWRKLTKIAVLHHHVSHLWNEQLELKLFEAVVDAHELKQFLIQQEFDFVLHGHKHTNNVSLDASLIPLLKKQIYHPLCIVSGGTVGGMPRPGDTQTFKLIEFKGKKGPRSEAIVREVPLKRVAAPKNVITGESKVYHVPLAKRTSRRHTIPRKRR